MNDSSAGVYLFYAAALWCAGEYRNAIDATDAGIRLVQHGSVRLRLLSIKAMAHAALGEMTEANAALDDALTSADPTSKTTLAGALVRVRLRKRRGSSSASSNGSNIRPLTQWSMPMLRYLTIVLSIGSTRQFAGTSGALSSPGVRILSTRNSVRTRVGMR